MHNPVILHKREETSILRNTLVLTIMPFMSKVFLPSHLSDNLVEFRILGQKQFIPQTFEVFSSCLLASSIVEKSVAVFMCNTLDMTFLILVSLSESFSGHSHIP